MKCINVYCRDTIQAEVVTYSDDLSEGKTSIYIITPSAMILYSDSVCLMAFRCLSLLREDIPYILKVVPVSSKHITHS